MPALNFQDRFADLVASGLKPPAPSAADTALADKLRRLQLSATAYANQVEVFTNALRKTIEQP